VAGAVRTLQCLPVTKENWGTAAIAIGIKNSKR